VKLDDPRLTSTDEAKAFLPHAQLQKASGEANYL
jgi:hypothetical protein